MQAALVATAEQYRVLFAEREKNQTLNREFAALYELARKLPRNGDQKDLNNPEKAREVVPDEDLTRTTIDFLFERMNDFQVRLDRLDANGCLEDDKDKQDNFFKGYTKLHDAIVNSQEAKVKELAKGNNVHKCAIGKFFKPSGRFYAGECPLSFVATQRNTNILDILMEKGADPFAQDELGNTVMHMCVIYDNVEMFNHLVQTMEDMERAGDPELLKKFWKASYDNIDKTYVATQSASQHIIEAPHQRNFESEPRQRQSSSIELQEINRARFPEDVGSSSATQPDELQGTNSSSLPMFGPISPQAEASTDMIMITPPTPTATLLTEALPAPRVPTPDLAQDTAEPKTSLFNREQYTNENREYVQLLLATKNKKGQTPEVLAGILGRVEMFHAIVTLQRVPLLTYGNMEASAYSIGAIDTYPIENRDPNFHGILHNIVYGTESDANERALLLTVTPIKQLLEDKWRQFGFALFWTNALCYLFFALIFTLVVCEIYDFREYPERYLALQVSTLISITVGLLLELIDIYQTGFIAYITERGTNLFSFFVWLNFSIIVAVAALRYGYPLPDNNLEIPYSCGQYCTSERVLLAFSSVTIWFYSLHFFRAYKQIGIFVVVLTQMLFGDITRFIIIFLSVFLGFVTAFANLYHLPITNPKYDPEWTPNLYSMSDSLRTLYKMLFGDFTDFGLFTGSWSSDVAVLLFIISTIMCNLLLLTMLIAALNYTFDTIVADSTRQASLERAKVILWLERRMCFFWGMRDRFRSGKQIDNNKEWFIIFKGTTDGSDGQAK